MNIIKKFSAIFGFSGRVQQFLTASSERWLTYRNRMPQKKLWQQRF